MTRQSHIRKAMIYTFRARLGNRERNLFLAAWHMRCAARERLADANRARDAQARADAMRALNRASREMAGRYAALTA